MMQEHSGKICTSLTLCCNRMSSSDCLSRKHIDHEMMSSCLLKEINTRLKMCDVDTVTSIYFGGGRSIDMLDQKPVELCIMGRLISYCSVL